MKLHGRIANQLQIYFQYCNSSTHHCVRMEHLCYSQNTSPFILVVHFYVIFNYNYNLRSIPHFACRRTPPPLFITHVQMLPNVFLLVAHHFMGGDLLVIYAGNILTTLFVQVDNWIEEYRSYRRTPCPITLPCHKTPPLLNTVVVYHITQHTACRYPLTPGC